jgi:hypothetical protein
MNQQLRAYFDDQTRAADEDLRQAIEMCGGDVAAALRAALISNALLVEGNGRLKKQVSKGFARGAKQ